MTNFNTREQWLVAASWHIERAVFRPVGHALPKDWRVTCGWPATGATRSQRRRIGECWDKIASSDKHVEILISPVLDDPLQVLDVLVHELVHGIVGCACGHKGAFRTVALACGLDGKMTSTFAGAELKAKLVKIAGKLGPYPHARINIDKQHKKQTTRLCKCECRECGYIVRTTAKWIAELGAPICPCNREVMETA